MRLDKMIIGLLIFGLFISIGLNTHLSMIGNDIDGYDLNITQDKFSAALTNATESIYNQSRDMQEDTFGSDIEGEDQSWESMTKGAYSALRITARSFLVIGEIINAIQKEIGFPPILIISAMTILLISAVFAIIYMIFRFKP